MERVTKDRVGFVFEKLVTKQLEKDDQTLYLYESQERRGHRKTLTYCESLLRFMLHCIVNDYDLGYHLACVRYQEQRDFEATQEKK